MTLESLISEFNPLQLFIQTLTVTSGHLRRKPVMVPPPPPQHEGDTQCELLGPLALIIQGTMGALAILSLLFKRSRESPQRPLWVWFFDVSKQVFGAFGLHVINLILSNLQSHSDEPDQDNNPCTWYFLNLLLDTTVGVPVLWFFLYMIHMTAFRIGITGIISGQYGDPPRWFSFIKQAGLYLIGMVCMKSVLYSIVQALPWLDNLGAFLLSWTNWSPELQVVFVILIFPLIMNTLQYYLIDTIIQSPEYHSYDTQADSTKGLLASNVERDAYGSVTPSPCVCHHDGYDFLGQREAEAESLAWHQRLLKISGVVTSPRTTDFTSSLSSVSSETLTCSPPRM